MTADTSSTDTTTTSTAEGGATPPEGDSGTAAPSGGGAVVTSTTASTSTDTAAASIDMDALRAQIRAEEMTKLQDELAHQLQAASSVVNKPATAPAPRSKADYRNMRATDVDPTTLTAPVLTLDGYVCPVPPEKK
ncbi:MAG TPA: hypothetical protein DCX52_14000 [Massilia sp.]|nr:hypothetical protein [Massilia sp.]